MKTASVEKLTGSLALCVVYLEKSKVDYVKLLETLEFKEQSDTGAIYLVFSPNTSLPFVLAETDDTGKTTYFVLKDWSAEIGNWEGPEFETFEQLATWWLMTYQ